VTSTGFSPLTGTNAPFRTTVNASCSLKSHTDPAGLVSTPEKLTLKWPALSARAVPAVIASTTAAATPTATSILFMLSSASSHLGDNRSVAYRSSVPHACPKAVPTESRPPRASQWPPAALRRQARPACAPRGPAVHKQPAGPRARQLRASARHHPANSGGL